MQSKLCQEASAEKDSEKKNKKRFREGGGAEYRIRNKALFELLAKLFQFQMSQTLNSPSETIQGIVGQIY